MQTKYEAEIEYPGKFKNLPKPSRYKVYYGGRGSGKSVSVATYLIEKALEERTRILCCREIQKSISESVIKLIAERINDLQLQDLFEVQKTTIKSVNGSEFIFAGLTSNVTSIKSMQGVKYVWIEEAENISEISFNLLSPTIRAAQSEIFITFNPWREDDFIYQRFVVNPPADCITTKVNWNDNPWFPEVLRQEMLSMREENYNKYLHIWEGMPDVDYLDSIIQPQWVEASIDAHIKLGFKKQGVISTGFDPADTGQDNKAVVTRWGSVIIDVHSWLDGGIEEAVDKAFSYAFDTRSDHIVFDAIGIGASVKMGLSERIRGKHIKVDAFQGAATPDIPKARYKNDRTNKDTFANKRAQYWWYIRDRFESTYLAVNSMKYTDPSELISISSEIGKDKISQLKSELTRVQRKRSGRGNDTIMLESKSDMKARQVKSPGLADALVYSFANSLPFHDEAPASELIPEYVEDY